MNLSIRFLSILTFACLCALSGIGCAGAEPSAAADIASELDTQSWRRIQSADVAEAPAGCEGVSLHDASFAVVDQARDLVAAIDAEGQARCVDSADAVFEALASTEGQEAAENAREGYLASVASDEMRMGPMVGQEIQGDPNPKPVTPVDVAATPGVDARQDLHETPHGIGQGLPGGADVPMPPPTAGPHS